MTNRRFIRIKAALGDYPECDTCLNAEHDPFQCESCDEASNYEPEDDDFGEFDDKEDNPLALLAA